MRAAPPPGEAATDSARTSETPTSRAAPPPDPELRTALVKRVQERLKDLGCYRGAIDGDWGRGSSGALDRALAEKPLPASIDMQELTATSANTVLAALTDDVRENCAKPVTSTVTQPRRASPESRTKSRPSRAQPARKTATKPARRCRSKMNPERFTDEKAPMMITVCE